MRAKWVIAIVASATVLLGAFLAGGGVYRTVNAGGGRVYIVNRFTGKTRVVHGEVVARLKTEAEAEREEARAEEERGKQVALRRERETAEAARASGAEFVGDRTSKLYHRAALTYGMMYDSSDRDPTCLADVTTPVYFSSALEATKEGYWPCQECLKSATGTVGAASAPVRAWPRTEAPTWFSLKRNEFVSILGVHSDFYAVPTEVSATGQRGVGWIAASAVEMSLTPDGLVTRWRWTDDRAAALALQKRGLSTAGIAEAKAWKADYVERLLANQHPDYERQSPPR